MRSLSQAGHYLLNVVADGYNTTRNVAQVLGPRDFVLYPSASIRCHDTMQSLYAYLRGDHEQLRSDIRQIDARARPAWATFLNCHVKGCWPYELTTKSPLPESIPSYSSSTSSMILYSLALALGKLQKSPLAPGLLEAIPSETLPSDRTGHEAAFVAGIKQLVEDAAKRTGAFVFESKSFGQDDPFTLTWCSELLRAVASSSNGELVQLRQQTSFGTFVTKFYERASARVKEALEAPMQSCLKFPSDSERNAIDHPFPLVRSLHLAQSLTQTNGHLGKAAEVARSNAQVLLETCGPTVYEHLVSRVHQQLSFHAMPNAQFDAAELVFALEGILLCGPHPGTAADELLQRVFQVIEERQLQNPYWRPLKPFVTTPQGFALLPLSVEIANSMLRICAIVAHSEEAKELFSSHLPLFTRYTEWLQSRVDHGVTKSKNNAQGKEFFGWHSEHVAVAGRVHTWETSQVLIYLLHLRAMLTKHVAQAALAAAYLKPIPTKTKTITATAFWEAQIETSEPLRACPDASDYRIFRRIKNDFLVRRDKKEDRPPYCSALLFGPPGTGKTRIAKTLARAMDWPLIVITPSDFVAQGVSEVEMRAKAIFDVLKEQSQAVVLFDEIDRLILDRDSKLYREQGDMFQFMTPGMLTKLHELRDAQRVVFLVATNYADRIDPAAKRMGRIDAKLLVTPPDVIQRSNILQQILKDRFAIDQSAGLVEEAAKTASLAIYGELEEIALSAMSTVQNKDRHDQVKEALTNSAGRFKPSLRLTAYESRFKLGTKATADPADAEFPSAQEPFEEFFVLVYLKCQPADPGPGKFINGLVPAIAEDERATIERAAGRLLTTGEFDALHNGEQAGISAMRSALGAYLRDDHILDVLCRCHFGVGVGGGKSKR